jgi:hypothetical protein
MSTSPATKANAILERDFNITFWREGTAQEICNVYDELREALPDRIAADIIQRVWNAACGEYGE